MTRFSNTTDRDGIIELIERGTNTQSITSSSYPLKVKTNDVNEALGHFFLLAIKAGGRFQVDDTNQVDLPVITTDVVASQPNYTFLVDNSTPSNQVLEIKKVRIKDSNGKWKNLTQIDRETFDINVYQDVTGTPEYYDLFGNSILVYPVANYASDEGLEMFIARTPSYFVSTDTTKQAGIPQTFHPYLHLRPSYMYAMIKGLSQAVGLREEVEKMEKHIESYYTKRNKAERPRFTIRQGGVDSNR